MAPTPESAAFLAKKPTVAASFDGVDYDDTRALKQAQDAIIREQWVKSMMARLVREELGKCYYREGVNHLEKCGKLRGVEGQGLFVRATELYLQAIGEKRAEACGVAYLGERIDLSVACTIHIGEGQKKSCWFAAGQLKA